MGGIISGFLGGASKGTAIAGQMLLGNTLAKERDEADDLRTRELRTDLQESRQEFLGADRDKMIETEISEGKKDRASREKVAKTRATGTGATTDMKNAESLMAMGIPKDRALAVAHGALKTIKDDETGDMILVDAISNEPVGRLTNSGGMGPKEWIPEGGQSENAPVSSVHRKAASEATSKKAGWLSTDETDFPETGGDRGAWRRQEAQRIANEERAGGKGGIVNNAAKPPATAAPTSKAPYPDGTKLKGKDGKTYIVKNGKPVLQEP